MRALLALLLLAATPTLAAATPDALVEGVVLPAWRVRDGARAPLAPGLTLRAGDELATGGGARILLRLSDGSQVKLGEAARLRVESLQGRRAGQDTFRAALALLAGAFRFTTDALARQTRPREVSVRFGTVTAGIRGTDLWGKSGPDHDLVCLLEGHISVAQQNADATELTRPGSVYQAPRGQAGALTEVSSEQIAAWSAETEIAPGQGALRGNGRWRVIAALAADQTQALALFDRLREAGYAAAIAPRSGGAAITYALQISGLPDRAEATALAARLVTAFPELKPAVTHR